MSIIRTKNQKKKKRKDFLAKFLFWRKAKKKESTASVYIGGRKVRKYVVTHNRGKRIIVWAVGITEAKDKAYETLRSRYPKKRIKIKDAWILEQSPESEVDSYES